MRKVTLISLLVLVLLIALIVPSCSCDGSDEIQPPLTSGSVVVVSGSAIPTSVEPDIVGKITSISITSDRAIILVEADAADETSAQQIYKKATVTVDLKTAIGKEESEESFTHLSLAAGDTVQVWFSSSVTETTPVQAYAQAVKIMRSEVVSDTMGVINLPRLVVNCGADSSLASATNVTWNGQSYNYGTVEEVLAKNLGSVVSVRCGETVSLKFSMTPDSYTVSYKTTEEDAIPTPIEPVNGKLNIPADAAGDYIYTVNVTYGENIVSYVFSVFAFV